MIALHALIHSLHIIKMIFFTHKTDMNFTDLIFLNTQN